MLTTTYDTLGKRIGQVTEIIIDDRYNISQFIFSNGDSCNREKIANFNNNISVLYGENDTVKISRLKPKFVMPKISNQPIVHILETPEVEPEKKPLILPNRAIANYRLLLDRKVTKNIRLMNGEVVIRQNSKINHAIIDIARRNGLLKELTQYSI